jgi:hypothetical protein
VEGAGAFRLVSAVEAGAGRSICAGIAGIARLTPLPKITSRWGEIAKEDSDMVFPESVGTMDS